MKTYQAHYEDNRTIIYAGRHDRLIGELPAGARPMDREKAGTLYRADGGDPFERARFVTPTGRVVVIACEEDAPRRALPDDPRSGASERRDAVAYLRKIAAAWRARTPFNAQLELTADEFDAAAEALEAGEHEREQKRAEVSTASA